MSKVKSEKLKVKSDGGMSIKFVRLIDVIHKPISGEWGEGEGAINVIRTTNFTNDGRLDLNEVVQRNIDSKKIHQKRLVFGDTIIEKSGGSPSQPVGRVVYFDQLNGIYLCNNFTSVIRSKADVDPRYLFWFLFNNHLTKNTLKYQNKTTGIINLQLERYIEELQIPLPPLATQKRIAEILDAADVLRRKDQELLKKYDELAQAIFIDMFGDPVKNEKGWVTEILKNITTKIGSGATPTGGKTAYKSEGISLIRSMNVYDFSFKWKDLAFIDEKQALRLNNVTVESGDVLFNITGASVCRCSIVPDELLPARVNQHVAIIRAKKDCLNPIFLNHLLVSNSVKTKLLSVGSAGGAVMEAITKEQLEQFGIIVPPIKLQNEFEQLIKNVFLQKSTEINAIKDSEGLFNSLIQKAFEGELVN
jgi:type I restriction enzyme S subunit